MSSPTSATRTIIGAWTATPSQPSLDLEAQVITGTRISFPALPSPAATRSSQTTRRSDDTNISSEAGVIEAFDAVDLFFGVTTHATRTRGTQDSRHDEVSRAPSVPSVHVEEDVDVAPPPYVEELELPSYSAVAEPPTLAMYLFKFGFFFPLFWLAGAVVLFTPLNPPAGWEPTKTEAERQELISLLRCTEVKWAKRCLCAFSALLVVMGLLTLAAVMFLRS